jgi:hypothetical protein
LALVWFDEVSPDCPAVVSEVVLMAENHPQVVKDQPKNEASEESDTELRELLLFPWVFSGRRAEHLPAPVEQLGQAFHHGCHSLPVQPPSGFAVGPSSSPFSGVGKSSHVAS